MGTSEAGAGGGRGDVVLWVCMTCGREYESEGGGSAGRSKCEKCGGEVFRRFEDAASPDEIQVEFREVTERDMATNDPEGDATPDDVRDLNP
jgi:predicted  nucleic acid-binding Zn-ribbon protein